jgi:hypothetical protein
MPGLDPGIQQRPCHAKRYRERKERNWIAGSSPAMTPFFLFSADELGP